jgi:hypothetical protein
MKKPLFAEGLFIFNLVYGVLGVTVLVGVAVGMGVATFAGTFSSSPIIRLVVSVSNGVMLFAVRYRLVSAIILSIVER